MRRIVEPLNAWADASKRRLQARLRSESGEPVYQARTWTLPVASAQLICASLAGLLAEGRTSVTQLALSRDHTERMLAGMGVRIRRDGLRLQLEVPMPCDFDVPGDISSAAFLYGRGRADPGIRTDN